LQKNALIQHNKLQNDSLLAKNIKVVGIV